MIFDRTEETQNHVWRSARTISILAALTSTVAGLAWFAKKNIIFWQWPIASVCCALFAILVFCYRAMPKWVAGAVSTLSVFATLIASAVTNYQAASYGSNFVPLAAFKIVPFVFAVVAPLPIVYAYFVLATCGIAPFVLYYLVFPDEVVGNFPVQEPWYTAMFALIGYFALRHRVQTLELERKLAHLKAERRSVDELARLFLGFRDLTNTPLQSIELTSRLLSTGILTAHEGSEHLERSLIRLRELSKLLTLYEGHVDWSQMSSSFDASSFLQGKMNEINSRK